MKDTERAGRLTLVGLGAMLLATLTKIVPSSTLAGYSIFIGIGFFFIVERVEKVPAEQSGLRFSTIFDDIKRPGVLLLTLLPVVSAVAALFIGDALFGGRFSAHVMGRTASMLSLDKIPMLIAQVVIAALGEEIAWRGFFVGKGIKLFPFWGCAVISSVLFAAGHIAVGEPGLVLFDMATIFIDSMIYAVIYRRSGNCLISTLSHILCNGAGLTACLIFVK